MADQKSFTIVVIGAGLSGVEVAAHLKNLGVELLRYHVASVQEHHVILDNHDTIAFNFTEEDMPLSSHRGGFPLVA